MSEKKSILAGTDRNEEPGEREKKSKHGTSETPAEGAGFSRRDFIRGTGLAGVAVSATVLLGDEVARAAGRTQSNGKWLGPDPVEITLRINGQARKLQAEPRVTLLDALRNRLDLTGAKKVCDRATCGACTVIIDGKAHYSCTTLAIDAQGHDILTIEGVGSEDKLHPVSQAFVDNDAQQCGFCTPGFVMASKAYLDHEPNPTYEGVQKALGGNLCRCGTYMGIRHATLEAAKKGGRA
ncbi:MAG TPA: (2Fe-2S)-binding protein [Candidatus Acidoferrales bacterium]|nr:(2Fe-2S)-binding protein [Candidatus Acidoferrales bacterium]